jgi:7-dehydrocholesterol reductase
MVWFLFQLVLALLPDCLHKIFPSYQGGIKQGNISPAGYTYDYNINGLQAWMISMIFFIVGSYKKYFSLTIIYDNWESILIITTVLAYIITTIAYIKAHICPSNPFDRKITSSKFYDYFMGIELNPRTFSLDWKLFLNGRPGIIGWSLINLSFAAAQYQEYGYITNSMVLVNILQTLYILYFFYREAWYLKTLDISHDHFGWMFSFGDLVWLPAMYTLQALYLVRHPIHLSFYYLLFVSLLGALGFYIFASSNNEKDRFRNTIKKLDTIDIEGQIYNTIIVMLDKPMRALICPYQTNDGKLHNSYLLISGWWGLCRHINYTGDIILSLAYSLACGYNHIFPYFYVIYLSLVLFHRSIRDEHKCLGKYGNNWVTYCRYVPYRFIPGII